MNDLFNYFKDIFSNSHRKKYTIEKFWELKIGVSLFNDFYSKFIQLVSDLKYTSEMLIWKLKYKLISQLQNWLNS